MELETNRGVKAPTFTDRITRITYRRETGKVEIAVGCFDRGPKCSTPGGGWKWAICLAAFFGSLYGWCVPISGFYVRVVADGSGGAAKCGVP